MIVNKIAYDVPNPYQKSNLPVYDIFSYRIIADRRKQTLELQSGLTIDIPKGSIGLLFPAENITLMGHMGVVEKDQEVKMVYHYKPMDTFPVQGDVMAKLVIIKI